MRIGRTIRQHLIDVDVGIVAAAILLAVDQRTSAIHVGGDLEIKTAEPLVERELEVLEPLRQNWRVRRDGELL
jgi:hypothetical protein